MSSSSRRVVCALLVGMPLAGCNLRPMLGGQHGEATVQELAAVEVDAPDSPLGQDLRNALVDQLRPRGVAAPSEYLLKLNIERTKSALAVQLDETITRYDTTIQARFDLRRKATAEVLLRGAARRVASYNVVRAPYATLVAEHDAEHRAVLELAIDIRTRLALHFGQDAA